MSYVRVSCTEIVLGPLQNPVLQRPLVYERDLYWTLRGIRAYEFMYKSSVDQDVMDIPNRAKADVMFKEQIQKYLYHALDQSTIYFGQNFPNPATIAGTLRMMVKSIAKD